MTNFMIPVKTELSAQQYKHLHAIAHELHTTVGALVAELVRRSLAGEPQKRRRGGRKSNYTTALGEQVWEGRRFRRSYNEIGAELGIGADTAQRYMRRYEAEIRAALIAARSHQVKEAGTA